MQYRWIISSLLPTLFVLSSSLSGVAQENPFRKPPEIGASDSNPFSDFPERPGGLRRPSEKPSSDDDQPVGQAEEIAKLKRMLKEATDQFEYQKAQVRQFKNKNAAFARTIEQLKLKVNHQESQIAAMTSAVKAKNELHQSMFEELLDSDEVERQLLALRHLVECLDSASMESRQCSLELHQPKILRRLCFLADSDVAGVKSLAARCLYVVSPGTAVEHGIQFAPRWKALEEFKFAHRKEAHFFVLLNEQMHAEYEEVALEEVIEDIQLKYNVPVRLETGIDPNLKMTFKFRDENFAIGMGSSLKKYGLSLGVADANLIVVKSSDPRASVPLSYNVKSLIDKGVKLDQIREIVGQVLDNMRFSVTPVGDHQFSLKANLADHYRVQRKLGTLATPIKW